MSVRWSTMSATSLSLGLLGEGEQIGEDTVPEGMVALVIAENDEAVAVLGTPQQLRERVYEGFGLPVPDSASLVDFPDTVAGL